MSRCSSVSFRCSPSLCSIPIGPAWPNSPGTIPLCGADLRAEEALRFSAALERATCLGFPGFSAALERAAGLGFPSRSAPALGLSGRFLSDFSVRRSCPSPFLRICANLSCSFSRCSSVRISRISLRILSVITRLCFGSLTSLILSVIFLRMAAILSCCSWLKSSPLSIFPPQPPPPPPRAIMPAPPPAEIRFGPACWAITPWLRIHTRPNTRIHFLAISLPFPKFPCLYFRPRTTQPSFRAFLVTISDSELHSLGYVLIVAFRPKR